MNARDAFLQVVSESDLSVRGITRAIDKAPGSLHHIFRKDGGSTPRADTLAKVADVCGYDLLLRRRTDEYEIQIDPYDE